MKPVRIECMCSTYGFSCLCIQIDESKSDFFPKEKALCLGGEEDQSDAQLEQIQEMIQDLLQRYRKKVSDRQVLQCAYCSSNLL